MSAPDRRQASPPQGSHELVNIEENTAGVNSPVYGGALLKKSLDMIKGWCYHLGDLEGPSESFRQPLKSRWCFRSP